MPCELDAVLPLAYVASSLSGGGTRRPLPLRENELRPLPEGLRGTDSKPASCRFRSSANGAKGAGRPGGGWCRTPVFSSAGSSSPRGVKCVYPSVETSLAACQLATGERELVRTLQGAAAEGATARSRGRHRVLRRLQRGVDLEPLVVVNEVGSGAVVS